MQKEGIFIEKETHTPYEPIISHKEDSHLNETPMQIYDRIVLRAFEYGFHYALSSQKHPDCLEFPEPSIIYLSKLDGIPKESVLHISFGNQGSFDYRIQNFLYLAHSMEDLEKKKMTILIPFQVLRLRDLLRKWKHCEKEKMPFDKNDFYQLQEKINNDIIKSIQLNLGLGNITKDDADQLYDLAERLREHICKDFKPHGGEEIMKPLLPGALELPNDKYRFRIDELEKEIKQYADENAKYADEIIKLKKRIAQLESRPS